MMDTPNHSDRPGHAALSSLADMVVAPISAPAALSRAGAVKIAVMAALFAAMNWWQFGPLVDIWRTDPNWTHGFIIPLFSLYLIYSRWGEIMSAERRVCLLGLPIMLGGIVLTLLGYYPIGTLWISQLSMIVVIFGLVLYLVGPSVMRLAWLPILYLSLAMPIPEMLYNSIALPLQNLAAASSTILLQVFGVQINATASRLDVTSLAGQEHTLTVAEACSGIRSLIAYVALGVAWAYLEYRPIWQRVVLVASAIPIAILLNVVRVTVTCLMYVIDRPEWGQDFMHEFMGMIMLAPALLLMWLLGRLLQNLFVEVEDDTKDSVRETSP
jgi:exosortase